MRIVQAPRASAILYHVLTSRPARGPWLLPANICPIVPLTFYKAHVPFAFVDISAETLHMDLQQVQDRIQEGRYGGILYSHTYGDPYTPGDQFRRLQSRNPELLIVDDRCLCIPEFDAPSCADVTLYSTGYSKIVDLGFGGYALLKDDLAYEPRDVDFRERDHEEMVRSYKAAIQKRSVYVYDDTDWLETEAAVPDWGTYRKQITNRLNAAMDGRAALNEIYASHLPAEMQFPTKYQSWRFNIRVKNRRAILEAIFQAGLFASSHYTSLTGIMGEGPSPQAEALANEVINLFNDHHFDADRAAQICDVILENHEG